ncbi:MAG: 3-deoxy-D-manno-octulosonic acid transferase [Bacteroidetes bacterium]|nr:3-deoxy-D-manno-octulosonic acid transferase [Bacteroidota bacterium]
MSLLYDFAIGAYASAIKIASVFNPKAKLWVDGRIGLIEKIKFTIPSDAHPIWVHCASLGEFEQGRPVIEAIKKAFPEKKILLTFFSPSGYEIRKKYSGADYIFYLPSDTPSNAKAFVEAINPAIAVFVKYEFWNNYYSELYQKEIPLYIISAIFRESQPFFQWYGGFWRNMLQKANHIFVQDEHSLSLLHSAGIKKASIAGDTRFDRVAETAIKAERIEEVEHFCSGSKILVAGSTWPADEQIIISLIKPSGTNFKFIIAPHEVDKIHLGQLENLLKGLEWVYYSDLIKGKGKDSKILVINNIGMLSRLYQYGNIAYIGGGFGKGIHNILEAAAFGLPIIFGPNYLKFKEARDLISKGGAFSINDEAGAAGIFKNLINMPEKATKAGAISKSYVMDNVGATGMILKMIKIRWGEIKSPNKLGLFIFILLFALSV